MVRSPSFQASQAEFPAATDGLQKVKPAWPRTVTDKISHATSLNGWESESSVTGEPRVVSHINTNFWLASGLSLGIPCV